MHNTRSPTHSDIRYTRGRIDTIDSPDDEHLIARNMQRIGINKYKEKEACIPHGHLHTVTYVIPEVVLIQLTLLMMST